MKCKCDNCGGSVINNICKYCGTNYRPIDSQNWYYNSSSSSESNVRPRLTLVGKITLSTLVIALLFGLKYLLIDAPVKKPEANTSPIEIHTMSWNGCPEYMSAKDKQKAILRDIQAWNSHNASSTLDSLCSGEGTVMKDGDQALLMMAVMGDGYGAYTGSTPVFTRNRIHY